MAESYKEYQQKIKDKQSGKSKDDIAKDLERKAEYVQDLDNLPKQTHNWMKRGIVVSCEGGDHPSHRHFLVNRRKMPVV